MGQGLLGLFMINILNKSSTESVLDKKLTTYIILALIVLIGIFLRFWQLGSIPSGSTNDEVAYIYNAYSIAITSKDIAGNFLPISFNLFNSFSPVAVYIMSPFVGILGLSLFTARLPFALIGIAEIFLIFLIAKKITNNYYIALSAAFVLSVSPWHLQFSRVSYDGILALFFYLLGIYVFLKKKDRGNINWSLPAFLLGFYSYHGTKIFMLLFIPALLLIFRNQIMGRKKEVFIFITGIILIILSFFYVVYSQNVNRQNVLLVKNISTISSVVNTERAYNSAQPVLRNILSNKVLTFLRIMRENYLEAFSPQFLFLYGETGDNEEIFGIGHRGVMYIIELPLLLFGIVYILRIKKLRNFLILGLLIAPIPSVITVDKSYGMRSIMMLPFLSIIAGCGIYEICIKFREMKKTYSVVFISAFVLLYAFLILEYLYQYHYRYGIYGAEAWLRSSRDVSEYIAQEKDKYKQVYIANEGGLLMQYALFNREDPYSVQAAYKSKILKNIYFIGNCIDTGNKPFDPKIYLPPSTLYVIPDCYKEVAVEPIKSIIQVGEPLHTVWKIYKN
ncbi:MAG: hypothetical protein A3H17_02820 [Candidatus Levybacteria bacterium RIFCSPLOWO2_12_FULL_37_14]|nr:MAG: hypothetical protein US43_C0038G0003 [Candidatus Levybacteria bacterium GW2011_GWA1_37_16]OGH51600.1 MAG: hypothetical protein A3H17_02820 [Candidatus Levybacteria bacterium RIFCSPLOWO2_12_FULL_37_14]